MIKAITVGILAMMLCFFSQGPAQAQEEPGTPQQEPTEPGAVPAVPVENALSADQVRKLFEGNTELGEGRKGDVDTGRRWTAFYASDGTVRKREGRSRSEKTGTWFVDSEGRNCFQFEGKEAPKCDAVVPEGDFYLRVREGQVRARVRIEKGNPSKL